MYHRIGIVASRKVGSAVVRNKFKRRMRELLPSFLEKVQIPHDCIVIATHPEIVTASFPKLQENLTLLFKKFSHLKYESAV